MAKFLSDRSAQRLGPALDAIESLAPRKRNAPRRRIRTAVEDGSVRRWVVITTVNSASDYVGDVYESPNRANLIESGVQIKVLYATSNAFGEGYADFADKVEESGTDVYYIDGFVLG